MCKPGYEGETERGGERKRERKKRRGCVWREMWWGRLEIEREREVAERRGPVQCRAGMDTQSSAFRTLPWKPHSSPACIPTDCLFFYCLYLSFFFLCAFHSSFNLRLCFSRLLPFFTCVAHTPVTTHTRRAYWFWCSALCVKVNG